jgi:hypothetical protein
MFCVPLATTEGALVASYNRGMKLAYAAGGVRTTVLADVMQRAPAFRLRQRPGGPRLRGLGDGSFAEIKAEAESTTRVGHLHDIEQFPASRFMFLRFNYITGDAAGQNLTGKATLRACTWIRSRYPGIRDFYLKANLATDKKSSHVNILPTRGKRVVAEATIPADLVRRVLHTTPGQMFRGRQVSNLGGLHIGSVVVFDGPAPSREDLMRLFEAKLPRMPRYRQVARTTPFQVLRRVWADDQHFAIRHHVRQATVRPPAARSNSALPRHGSSPCGWTGAGRCGRSGSWTGWRAAAGPSCPRSTTAWWTGSAATT